MWSKILWLICVNFNESPISFLAKASSGRGFLCKTIPRVIPMSQKLLVPQDILSHFGPFRKCCRFYVVSLEGFDKDGTIGLESAIDVRNTLSYLFKRMVKVDLHRF